ncbi:MAG TPA: chromosome partitioning protein ParB, partial [Candidatus Binatia bacterium]|nr:chromosome partitioning protein ParB [Candidatus Binatia bacterium]
MAEKRARKKAVGPRKRRKLPGRSIGLLPNELSNGTPGAAVDELRKAIADDGGTVLAAYREPFSGHWVVLASLPIDQIEPTPYQRNVSDAHVRKLEKVIAKLGRFLDPIIVVRKHAAGA